MADPPRTFRPPTRSHPGAEEEVPRSVTPPNRPAIDPRRATGRFAQHDPPLQAPRYAPPPPGFERWAAEFRSETREEMRAMQAGIAEHVKERVDAAVESKLAPHTRKLDYVLLALDNDQRERRAYREAESKTREEMASMLGLRKTNAETEKLTTDTQIAKLSAPWARYTPVIVAFGAVLAAIVAAATATINSRVRTPAPATSSTR